MRTCPRNSRACSSPRGPPVKIGGSAPTCPFLFAPPASSPLASGRAPPCVLPFLRPRASWTFWPWASCRRGCCATRRNRNRVTSSSSSWTPPRPPRPRRRAAAAAAPSSALTAGSSSSVSSGRSRRRRTSARARSRSPPASRSAWLASSLLRPSNSAISTLRGRGALVSDMVLISGSPACVYLSAGARVRYKTAGGPRARDRLGSGRAVPVTGSARAAPRVGRDSAATTHRRADALGWRYLFRVRCCPQGPVSRRELYQRDERH